MAISTKGRTINIKAKIPFSFYMRMLMIRIFDGCKWFDTRKWCLKACGTIEWSVGGRKWKRLTPPRAQATSA